ncbi:MAG TPA: glycosyltransferase family 4 protein [Acidimicrobiia bacterium]
MNPRRSGSTSPALPKLSEIADEAGLRRIHFLAWRDLEDPEAGGSELHAAEIARVWAEAGIEVNFRTSYAAGHPQVSWRDGYRVIRKAGRYLVFPRAALSESMGWHGSRDGLVEIWNGMPFFSPLWAPGPRIVFLHHMHAEMWDMTLPPRLAKLGRTIESRIAPLVYRRSHIVTLSESSKRELVEDLGFRAERITVVPPGIDPRYSPGGKRSPDPLVVAVGRLVPVKQFPALVDALVALKPRHPKLRAMIIGEGYERESLEAYIDEAGASGWIRLTGRVDDAKLLSLYQQAWLVASTSAREGWGMTITEAAACGTPAVVSNIAGHRDAVAHGRTGFLADTPEEMIAYMDSILGDDAQRARMSAAALEHASRFTWEATARGALEALATEARRLHRR